jgi:ABC-type dipeptide/oligopeptide/nickel transport system ATPase component
MPHIVNIRGTSGSGKSTAVRAIMNLSIEAAVKTGRLGVNPFYADPAVFGKKRKNPLFYLCEFPGHPDVAVLGHYGADCGGCDTLPNYEFIMNLIWERYQEGQHVIFEGLLLSHDKKQVTALYERLGKKDFTVLELTETLETCLASVRERRVRKGDSPDFNTANTVRRHGEVIRASLQLEERGIPVRRVSRAECVPAVLELLGLRSEALAA